MVCNQAMELIELFSIHSHICDWQSVDHKQIPKVQVSQSKYDEP